MSFTPNQDHKFTEAEKQYFLQHTWGPAAIAENDEIHGLDKQEPPKFSKEVFDAVKALDAAQLDSALDSRKLSKDGSDKDKRIRLATDMQEKSE